MHRHDLDLLAALLRAPEASHDALANELAVPVSELAARITSLVERGIIAGWAALPSADVFGREPRLHYVEDLSDEAMVAALVAADPVAWISTKADGSGSFVTYDVPGNQMRSFDVEEALAGQPVQTVDPVSFRSAATPALEPADRRVLRAMLGAPRAGPAQLARQTGLDPHDVQRRREALLAAGHVSVLPTIVSPGDADTLLVHLNLGFESPAALQACLEAVPEAAVVVRMDDPPGLYLLVAASPIEQVGKLEERVASVEGLSALNVDLPRGFVVARERLEAWCAPPRGTAERGDPA